MLVNPCTWANHCRCTWAVHVQSILLYNERKDYAPQNSVSDANWSFRSYSLSSQPFPHLSFTYWACNSSTKFKHNYRVGDAKLTENLQTVTLLICLWMFLIRRSTLCYKNHSNISDLYCININSCPQNWETVNPSCKCLCSFYLNTLNLSILELCDNSVLIYKSKIPPTMRIYNNQCSAQEQAYCPIWCKWTRMSAFLHTDVQETLENTQSKTPCLFKYHQWPQKSKSIFGTLLLT